MINFWPCTQSHGLGIHRCHVHVRTEAKSWRARHKYACRLMPEGRCLRVPICAPWALWVIALEPYRIKTGFIGMPAAGKKDVETSFRMQGHKRSRTVGNKSFCCAARCIFWPRIRTKAGRRVRLRTDKFCGTSFLGTNRPLAKLMASPLRGSR